jgi:hypothetical protein
MPETRELLESTILSRCDYFVDVQLWPIHERLDVQGWLSNFSAGDPHALHLLNGFMYYPDGFLNQMVMRSLKQLSPEVCGLKGDFHGTIADWKAFLDHVIITFPTDDPNPTDSGHEFVRRVREIGVPEAQILSPRDALNALAAGTKPSALIFVDDFVGTGIQFRNTWIGSFGTANSFESIHAAEPFKTIYAPLFCTVLGESELANYCPEVLVRPLHRLDDRYSALNPDGFIWPDSLSGSGPQFIQTASQQAGIPDTGGSMPNDWRGFARLGLALAIGRFVPDATLPMFYWKENGWTPLVRRH